MINVSFTNQELDTLLRLLDIAVKAQGLNVAGAAFILQQKVAYAVEAANKPGGLPEAPEETPG